MRVKCIRTNTKYLEPHRITFLRCNIFQSGVTVKLLLVLNKDLQQDSNSFQLESNSRFFESSTLFAKELCIRVRFLNHHNFFQERLLLFCMVEIFWWLNRHDRLFIRVYRSLCILFRGFNYKKLILSKGVPKISARNSKWICLDF